MKDLDQAREWAKWSKAVDQERPHTPATAAAEVILSLPDRWIGVDEIREAINSQLSSYPQGTVGHRVVEDIACKLHALLDPPPQPRTLADMSLDELKAYIGKDVMVVGWANPSTLVSVIDDEGAVLAHRLNKPWPFVEVRPLSDLTPVESPEQEAEVTSVNGAVTKDSPLNVRIDSLFGYDPTGEETQNPEDVPEWEPWLVRYERKEWVGVRANEGGLPWSLVSMDGLNFRDVSDHFVSLVSRLVPEVE